MADYKLTVGLEIHAELKTRTKMFCDSKNDPDEGRPNHNICPVCMGYPGTLPVINKEAVKSILKLGVAVGGKLADYTEFDRKNYFYPDIPKGYQISQYKHPLVKGGSINGVALTRIHLEEDTASSSHEGETHSLVDFNRAGVPLMEMVTEPVIHSAEEAMNFGKELQLLLRYLGISEANMEKGEMRVEANISVSKTGELGTKVEVKNINSFRAAGKAIEFEYKRQTSLLERGEVIAQETRGWDENKSETFSQRAKEESHDYRYFPDPDLPKLFISEIEEFALEALRKTLPELPEEKRERYKKDFGLKDEDIEIYVRDTEWGNFFEEVSGRLGDVRGVARKDLMQLASNYITSDLKIPVEVGAFAEVIRMVDGEEISSRAAKDILKVLETEKGDPRKIAGEKNLMQLNDREELKKIAEEVVKENPNAPQAFLVGQTIKKSEGRGNPKILKEIVEELVK
jgi:aspartyl-tRNA(Asn)/glutamyl-tRNA(Gln) amidotransferase subunit B